MTPLSVKAGAAAVVLVALSPTARSQPQTCEGTPGNDRIVIDVTGVRAAKGDMTATLYGDDKSRFLVKDGALKVWRVAAAAPVTQMCIYVKGPGTYAVAVYQDVDRNGQWDHASLFRIEPFGFSRNPTILFSAPSFEQVRFAAAAGTTTITVRLNHR
ncbi:MAG TPA: DUF2141 domain-containing protein [Caulobacteraceae bacterium]|nr:DUF2141 domain-containing protein [Caulobacteraceae bacterium]